MTLYLVTVKIPKSTDHDPRNKQTGGCPITGGPCTDVTGEHHTVLTSAPSIDHVRSAYADYHITRIEEAVRT